MRKLKLLPVVSIGFSVLMASCAKEGPTGPTGPAGPAYTGAISGHVSLYDQYGSKVLTGLSTAQLSLNGGTATTPDATGYYIFSNTTTGQYSIGASASGYGSTNANNFQYLSGTLNKDIKMSAIPSFAPTGFTAYQSVASSGDSLVITFDADSRARNCIVFLNNTSTVNNQPVNYLLYYAKGIAANATKATIVIPAQDLYDAGFTSGSTVYYAAYGYVLSDASSYEDLATGKAVITPVSTTSSTATATTP